VGNVTKKVILLALVVVMMASTAALAFGGGMKDFGPRMDFDCSGSTRMVPRQGLQRDRNVQQIEYPQEIQAQFSELRRTHLEMRLALAQEEPDIDKAKLLFEKAQGIRNEISKWRFERYIESLKK
jgi:Spy/CpxP family protein refolding chaperone